MKTAEFQGLYINWVVALVTSTLIPSSGMIIGLPVQLRLCGRWGVGSPRSRWGMFLSPVAMRKLMPSKKLCTFIPPPHDRWHQDLVPNSHACFCDDISCHDRCRSSVGAQWGMGRSARWPGRGAVHMVAHLPLPGSMLCGAFLSQGP